MENKNLTNGFHLCNIKKNQINDAEFMQEVESKDNKINQEVMDVIKNKGKVYGFKKDKKLKAIFIFEKVKNEKKATLKLSKKIYIDEINEEMQKQLEQILISYISQYVALEEISKIIFEDKEIVPELIKVGKFRITLGTLILLLSTIIGIAFFNKSWYIFMGAGIAIDAIYGAVVKTKSK